ncbi:inner centromere protein A-like [Apus apus]|uniref:inner centromere protein A-like n=1 Tax=Apus apus TaxID=8895 RepID=UPI0021F835D3|nr:inner centromere protein A-like [Apus apus]
MAAAGGPTRLLEVCGQRLSRFLRDAEHKQLAWLREVEEQGLRMLDSNFGAEPELMPKTPSQRRRPRKRQSWGLKEESKELNRRRLSRRRSSIKVVSSKASSQQQHREEQAQNPSAQGEEVAVPSCARRSQARELPEPAGKGLEEGSVVTADGQDCPWGAGSRDAAHGTATGEAGSELQDVSSVPAVPGGRRAKEEEAPNRRASTSTPKAARDGDPAMLQGDLSPQSLEKLLFQDSESKMAVASSKTRRCSGRRSLAGGSHRSHRASLAQKCSLAGRRDSVIQRSVSRARSKKAAGQESSSASSRVSCQSSLEVFVEDDVSSSVRPGLELHPPSEKAAEDVPTSSKSLQAASPPAQHVPPPEQQAGSSEGSSVNPSSQSQKEDQEQPHAARSQENPSRIWTRSYKQAMGALWGQQPGGRPLSPLDDKNRNPANPAPPCSSPASKVVRPLKNFLQAVQGTQLLGTPGSAGRGGVIRNFIKRSTPTRPDIKGDFVEKERQRLESLRKKQEAEEQRRKKVEEEKQRRQAEMKQRREERLRKALQARERVEQMEEQKKKRMEQKILQSDEKAREERGAEERGRKKLSKRHGEADTRKQKVLKVEVDEFEQQEPLQKRREDEVKEKEKKVLELKNLVEQHQAEQGKERDHKQRGKEKPPQLQVESAVLPEKNIKEKERPKELHQRPGQEKRAKQPEAFAMAANPWLRAVKQEEGVLQEPRELLGEEKKNKQPEALAAASGTWLSKTVQKPIYTSYLGPLKGTEKSRCPKGNENNYGMDLNSDDSTDDENEPRKPVPVWADGTWLNQAITHQYYHPVDVDQLFGLIPSPRLEDIFGKSKPRYFKRTSSAVWLSPPGTRGTCCPSCNFEN